MKAYKIFNNDWTCNGFQYEVGKTYHIEGELEMCHNGFHACEKLHNCFEYYACVPWNKIAEVELSGIILGLDENKQCSESITIIKEISFDDIGKIIKDGVNESEGVNWSDGVNGSKGVNRSEGVNESYAIFNCDGVSNTLFLANKKNQYNIFGKEVTEQRFNEVKENLTFIPEFNNLKELYLKNGSKWKKTPICNAEEIQKEEAWSKMPKEQLEYIKALPEFDAEMFFEITGLR